MERSNLFEPGDQVYLTHPLELMHPPMGNVLTMEPFEVGTSFAVLRIDRGCVGLTDAQGRFLSTSPETFSYFARERRKGGPLTRERIDQVVDGSQVRVESLEAMEKFRNLCRARYNAAIEQTRD